MPDPSIYSQLNFLSTQLAYCTYLYRLNNELLWEATHSTPEDGNYDLCVVSNRLTAQQRDVMLVQRDFLIEKINAVLSQIDGCHLQLCADPQNPWVILLSGDEENPLFHVNFHSVSTLPKLKSQRLESLALIFPQIDFGDIGRVELDRYSGEVWTISGDIGLGQALWPFRINLDANCILLSQSDGILVCDTSEK